MKFAVGSPSAPSGDTNATTFATAVALNSKAAVRKLAKIALFKSVRLKAQYLTTMNLLRFTAKNATSNFIAHSGSIP